MGAGGDKGSSIPVPTLVPERKQMQSKSQLLSLSLHAQTPSGTGRKSGVKGARVRLVESTLAQCVAFGG